ncbi:MAG: hypothetical protein IJG63_05655, partial [Oscillospiraceae bacterium]|nr:hypothetical protein [Oscillospiraceae bacterium]
MEDGSLFDKNSEKRSMEYFSFSAKVFNRCRIVLIPVAVIYAAMRAYAYRLGTSPAGGVLFLVCIAAYAAFMSKSENAYRQYAREAQTAMEQGSTAPYSQRALELRNI